jgi:integration host factor subunit alpha
MALTRDDIIDRLVDKCNLRRREATDLLDTFLEETKEAVEHNAYVRWPGFGLFKREKTSYKKKKATINPDDLPEWEVIKFKAAPALNKRVQRAIIEEDRDED